MLFTLQLGVFLVQEVAEALATGLAPDPPPLLFLWGSLGQLPVACLAAVALSWLSTRLEAAIEELRVRIRAEVRRRPPLLAARPVTSPAMPDPMRAAAPLVFGKRGPPNLPP